MLVSIRYPVSPLSHLHVKCRHILSPETSTPVNYHCPPQVHISDNDISMMLNVLQHNLEEGKIPQAAEELLHDEGIVGCV